MNVSLTNNPSDILVEGNYYRVVNIKEINNKYNSIKDIINIEEKNNQIKIINILQYKEEIDDIELLDVNCRSINILEYTDEDIITYFERIQEYYNCLDFAKNVLIDRYQKIQSKIEDMEVMNNESFVI